MDLVVEAAADGVVPEERGAGEVCDFDSGDAAVLAVVEHEGAPRRELLRPRLGVRLQREEGREAVLPRELELRLRGRRHP